MELNDLKVAGPISTELTAPFWQGAQEGRLTIQQCCDCGRHIFYPRNICPHCWSKSLIWQKASGQGWLKSYSRVHRPGHPGWMPVAPYVVGLVELDEGPTMLSFIVEAKEELTLGMPLRLAPTDIGGRRLPAFTPL